MKNFHLFTESFCDANFCLFVVSTFFGVIDRAYHYAKKHCFLAPLVLFRFWGNYYIFEHVFFNSAINVGTFRELTRLINDLNGNQLFEALESLQLVFSVTRRGRCSRLRKGVQLYKGMLFRASDVTSLITDATDQDDNELSSGGAAASVVTTSPVFLTVESFVTITSTMTLATGVVNFVNPSEILTTTRSLLTLATPRVSPTTFPIHHTPGHVGHSYIYANFYELPNFFPLTDRPSSQITSDFPISDVFRFLEDIRRNTLNFPSAPHSTLNQNARRNTLSLLRASQSSSLKQPSVLHSTLNFRAA